MTEPAETNGSLRIRPYQPSDRDAVFGIWAVAFPDPSPHNDPGRTIAMKMAEDPELFLVAESAGEVVGTVIGGWDGHRGWIYSLAVTPSYQGRGIGTDLVRDIQRRLVQLGCIKVNLQVRETNAEVTRFYQKLGFAAEPMISMGKRLYEGGDPSRPITL